MKYFLFCITFFSVTALVAQSAQIMLTKQQMYEDYDEFCRIIADVNPQLVLRKKVTGVDVVDYLFRQRAAIDTITHPADFIKILFKGMAICNDGHAHAITNEDRINAIYKEDTLKAKKIITLLNQYYDGLEKSFRDKMKQLLLFLEYYQGDYYSLGELILNANGKIDTLLPGTKIISIGGTIIDSLVAVRTGKWDVVRKKLYGTIVGSLPVKRKDTIVLYYEYQGAQKNLAIATEQLKQTSSGGAYLTNPFWPDERKGYVNYFPEKELLYIRLPAMEDTADFYRKEIIQKGSNAPIEKVVIDIRQNGGGSDWVWMNILSAILKDTLDIKTPIGLKNTDRAIKAKGVSRDTLEMVKVPLLDNEEFLILEWGEKIVPYVENIGYTGKIYVLQDRRIYSAAGSLSNMAHLYDNIVSVGETTGKLLGFGVTPLAFSLPHSGFVFQLEPVLDLSNAETLWDYYHDHVEIPVDISVEQRVKYFNSAIEGDIYSKEFLFNHDPVFQKVLEQEE